jgi:hypothetical protein
MLALLAACSNGPSKAPAGSSSSTVLAATGAVTFDVALAEPTDASSGAAAAAAAVGQRIAACYKAPTAADASPVLLRVSFAQDGSVGAVETLERQRFASEPAYRESAIIATRAIVQCAPFSLSAADYGSWKSLALRLTPRHI